MILIAHRNTAIDINKEHIFVLFPLYIGNENLPVKSLSDRSKCTRPVRAESDESIVPWNTIHIYSDGSKHVR